MLFFVATKFQDNKKADVTESTVVVANFTGCIKKGSYAAFFNYSIWTFIVSLPFLPVMVNRYIPDGGFRSSCQVY